MNKRIFKKPELVPLSKVSFEDLPKIRIGEDFFDLARLGLIGEYTEVPPTEECPRLYYRWNYVEGYWEIYATEHDLIGYNLGSVTEIRDRVEKLEEEIPTEEPTEEPTEPPTEEPTEPPFVHSKIDRDQDLTGGDDLAKIIDGGLMILGGKIRWYEASRKFPVAGNYVGVTITADPSVWEKYSDSVVVEYKGVTYGKEVFTPDGKLTLYPMIKVPGQETPITIFWNDEYREPFVVAITQESELEKL